MAPRLLQNTKWICCFLVVSAWRGGSSVSVKSPPQGPATVEAQAKFFQDFFSVQLSPYKMEFGHVCEDPNTWEQRYEKKDFKNHRDMGKVRWGDKQGGYGEHYWDLNHAGHTDNHNHGHDDDDGSYHSGESDDPYDEPSEQLPAYNDEYDIEKSAQSPFDESNRAKRAHAKVKVDKKLDEAKTRRNTRDEYKTTTEEPKNEETEAPKYEPTKLKPKSEETEAPKYKPAKLKPNSEETEAPKYKPAKLNNYKPKELNYDEDQQNPSEPDQAPRAAQPEPRYQPHRHETRYVPYEAGAGLRKYRQPQAAASSAPRLFLEPSTGHVVDRATGQAYILQPISFNYD